MQEREPGAGPAGPPADPQIPARPTVGRKRAVSFGLALGILLQQQGYYLSLSGTYLLPQFYRRLRAVDGRGINTTALQAYLQGTAFPSERKVRLLADALEISRGLLLFAAGYVTPQDLPDYPGPQSTLSAIRDDIHEVERLPLSDEARQGILASLNNTARILRMVHAERPEAEWHAEPNERELIIERVIDLWESPAPEEVAFSRRGGKETGKRGAHVPLVAGRSQPEPIESAPPEEAGRQQASGGESGI
jgi:hypothetical protein